MRRTKGNRSRKRTSPSGLRMVADGRLVKVVRNSNYLGEWKKGVFAGEDYRAKRQGDAIFLHAGCRKDTLEAAHGPYLTTYSLFVALSANGKTSTTCRILARKGRERSWLLQDDGGILTPRRAVPRLRSGRALRQDRLPQSGRSDGSLLRLLAAGNVSGERPRRAGRQLGLLQPGANLQRARRDRTPRLYARRRPDQRRTGRQPVHHHPGQHHPRHRQIVPRASRGVHGPRTVRWSPPRGIRPRPAS